MDKRYQVFVSSTYRDLKEVRSAVTQVLLKMRCIPAGMELFTATNSEQMEVIKKVIDDCDYYVLIVGNRYGSQAKSGLSFTEEEYNYAVQRGMSVLAFLPRNPGKIVLENSDIEPDLMSRLEAFRARVSENRLVEFWDDASQIPALVSTSLSQEIIKVPAVGWVRANNVASQEALVEMHNLRRKCDSLTAKLKHYESQEPPADLNLAPMDATYSVRLLYLWSHPNQEHTARQSLNERKRQTERKVQNVVVSWMDLFHIIAPSLIEHPPDAKVRKTLAEGLYTRYVNEWPPKEVSVTDSDYGQIRLQLTTYGLVSVTFPFVSSRNGHKTSGALTWKLTPKGQQLLQSSLTIKAKNGI